MRGNLDVGWLGTGLVETNAAIGDHLDTSRHGELDQPDSPLIEHVTREPVCQGRNRH
jgi:hypothetical protein